MDLANLWLQQYLPLAVLKLVVLKMRKVQYSAVATVPTACGIETLLHIQFL